MEWRRFGWAAAMLALWSPAGAPAAEVRVPRIVLAVDGVEQTRNLPMLLAERLGYFRNEGLTVTLVDAPAEPTPAQLVADGRADGAVAFYHHTFMSQADDHAVTQAVVVMGATPQLKLIVASRLRGQVSSVASLKGRRIFVGGGNSGKTTTMNWLALRSGFGVKDYQALNPTKREAMVAALKSGEADAIIAHEPDASYYTTSGAGFQLADINSVDGTRASLGSIYPSTSLYLPKEFIDAHPDVVQHLVNACLRAMRFINTHSAEQIAAVLPAKTGGPDRQAFLRLLAEDKQAFATDGRMPANAARKELEAMTALSPKYGAVKLDETYTNGFVDHAPRS